MVMMRIEYLGILEILHCYICGMWSFAQHDVRLGTCVVFAASRWRCRDGDAPQVLLTPRDTDENTDESSAQ